MVRATRSGGGRRGARALEQADQGLSAFLHTSHRETNQGVCSLTMGCSVLLHGPLWSPVALCKVGASNPVVWCPCRLLSYCSTNICTVHGTEGWLSGEKWDGMGVPVKPGLDDTSA